MAGWNGGHESSWSYRQDHETAGSNVSGSSGTIVSRFSTAYTSSSSGFSTFSMEAVAMHLDSMGIHGEHNGSKVDDDYDGESKTWYWEEAEEKDRMEHVTSLVQEFFSAPSANCSIKFGDMSAVERWLTELGVGWVLCLELNDGASAEEELYGGDARSWIRALDVIAQTICFIRPLFLDRGSMRLPSICEEQGEHVAERCIPDQYHFVLFIQETMLKMLNFVDVVVLWDPNTREEFPSMDRVMLPAPYNKLITLLRMHDALCGASNKILTLFDSPKTSVEVQKTENKMVVLLSTNKRKTGEAIRSTMEKIRTMSMEDGDGSSSSLNPEWSSDIHKVTRSVMTYIRFLLLNYSLVDAAIPNNYVPRIENVRALNSMIMEMVSCLQEKLANISQSILDQGLRFLFLLNNSYFIQSSQPGFYYLGLNYQIKSHMERYVQGSWAPLQSYLFNPVPLCLGKNYSPLSKFESEFQKIYTTQKEWKVPDPGLRRELRRVIIDKIIPGYTEYIDENKVTNPKFSPQELKAMLQELFEG